MEWAIRSVHCRDWIKRVWIVASFVIGLTSQSWRQERIAMRSRLNDDRELKEVVHWSISNKCCWPFSEPYCLRRIVVKRIRPFLDGLLSSIILSSADSYSSFIYSISRFLILRILLLLYLFLRLRLASSNHFRCTFNVPITSFVTTIRLSRTDVSIKTNELVPQWIEWLTPLFHYQLSSIYHIVSICNQRLQHIRIFLIQQSLSATARPAIAFANMNSHCVFVYLLLMVWMKHDWLVVNVCLDDCENL